MKTSMYYVLIGLIGPHGKNKKGDTIVLHHSFETHTAARLFTDAHEYGFGRGEPFYIKSGICIGKKAYVCSTIRKYERNLYLPIELFPDCPMAWAGWDFQTDSPLVR